MPKKSDLKFVALTAVSVMIAGYIMFQLSDVQVIGDARRGFDA